MQADSDPNAFDDEWYLRAYPDVARAISEGLIRSGQQHYLLHGRAEGRLPNETAPPAAVRPAEVPALKPLNWPPIRVELHASSPELAAMLERVKRNFEFMGEREPHWSVLTAERFLAENITQSEDEFFASGKGPVIQLKATAARYGIELEPGMSCFELGCGLGRSTIWLAELFDHVTGSDISRPHLEIAAATARRFGRDNADFVLIDSPERIRSLPPFDMFFSIIVLQHNPPPLIQRYLSEILQKLKPGGFGYFQLPTYYPGYDFSIANYLASDGRLGMPEMHVVPQSNLYALFEQTGCHLIEVREDDSSGGDYISNRFLVAKA